MKHIVECVPNFSEGRDAKTIEAIAQSIRAVDRVKLLNIEPDKDYNRTVVTFVGEPDAVVEAAYQATKAAAHHIDMRGHKGEHPRIGAVDVVPFVPVLANEYGRRVSADLKIPIYLYEYAAATPDRRNLATIRKGEYEGLEKKLQDPAWKPDYGNAEFNPKSGATVAGARKFLIAYNVNLNTPNASIAQEIALRIREIGRPLKNSAGKVVKNEKGESVKVPGVLKAVKAMGVFLERFHIAQVSINLVDYETTGPHTAYEEVKKQALSLGCDATGSEIVGLTPMNALLIAGRHFMTADQKKKGLSEKGLVALAVDKLGLSQLEPFDPKKKIIEYML
ncbi:MAG: Formimidoyltransferase-cyclodeaminase (Formiminotransferase-cyclodeaminase) [Bacteroidetes bacterium]|nr:Formimidoyltransferase-cyclodeaminase (Formiminotransferase-cyclodeaminase) [Bacteroidota bacterium]